MDSWQRTPLGIDVLTAARQRIAWIFDHVPRIYVSFSGGKDSTVMLHLVMDEAITRGVKVGVLFIDWEAQYKLTIDHVQAMFDRYQDHIDPHWVCVPLKTVNATSQYEPEWTCWEAGKEARWVREKPAHAKTEYPFYTPGMTFEEFVPAFGHWYGGGKLTASLVGIRTGESLNRWRALTRKKSTLEDKQWTTWMSQHLYNAYPVYDWQTEDLWTYHAQTGMPYNTLYDRFFQAGASIHQMRICEPYGDEQRRGLWMYQVIEPETWGKLVARVAGANTGALYAQESGNVLGNIKVTKPEGHTWESFAMLLLGSMPEATAEHYRNKIAVWLHWYAERNMPVEDFRHGDTGAQDMPSWRRVCKMLLKNDYWCQTLCFSATKSAAYERYQKLMRKRRDQWGLI